MYFFVNDYNDIGIVEVLEALVKASNEYNVGYGFDDHSKNARKLIKKALKNENIDIHFIPGGTSANILGLACGLMQQDSIIAPKTGHIEGHEAGSIEATGLKIETIPTDDGKLSPSLIKKKLKHFGTEFATVPKKVYISNTTELGGVYTKAELKNLYEFCKANDLYLFIDGARLAHALVSDICDYDMSDLCELCDIFYLGGTKNGLMLAEALVIVNDDLKKNFINLQKQKGALLAKGFVPGIMFEEVFKTSDGYLKGARHAYSMAKDLSNGLTNLGYELSYPFQSNQIFVNLNKDQLKKWQDIARFEIMEENDDSYIVRLVTTYRTSSDDVSGFLEDIK